MATMDLLSNKFQAFLEEEMIDCEIPSCIKDNINKKFELRPYQIESQSLLRYYVEKYKKKVKPVHLMFNLATGSGKTLLMASNILYLYDRGYRNFIFFVNSTNIIDKTKYNFLDYTSSKFLFNTKITINNKIVDIREVSNLEDADDDSINIMFTTIQGLH
ncbi:DEAD/DEAH box helicase family protein, partial [Terrisporobacter petrolearius]|uniref:DEAD/DEAH box helicase family protein n=1 Tax=Terrisporobacter petrolearius TaxID=1460447 RepID=UPI0022E7B5CD